MKRDALMRHLHQQGCQVLREGAGHTIVVNPKNQRQATVPRHSEIATFTMRGICQQLAVRTPRGA